MKKEPEGFERDVPGSRLLVRTGDAALMLAVSQRKLWSMTASGEIPHVRIGRSVRYPVVELQNWVNQHTEGNR